MAGVEQHRELDRELVVRPSQRGQPGLDNLILSLTSSALLTLCLTPVTTAPATVIVPADGGRNKPDRVLLLLREVILILAGTVASLPDCSCWSAVVLDHSPLSETW